MKSEQIKLRDTARKISASRWFWRALLAVALVAAVGYLKVTLLAPLGGDDQYGNLSVYYKLTTQGAWDVWMQELQGIWQALTLNDSRFFPFNSLPAPIRYWLRGNISSYRLYIIGHTLVDAAVLGLLVSKATGRKALGGAAFALLPLMLCLFDYYQNNGMYSYAALPQAVLLPALLAGLCMVALHKSRHVRWAVLGGLLTFWSCGTYEMGYTYIFMLGVLALLLEPRFWRAVCLGLPFLAGELAALFFYIMSSRLHASQGVYEGVQVAMEPAAVLRTWVQQMSGGFPLNIPLLSDAEPQNLTAGDVVFPFLLALVMVLFLLLGKPSLTLRQGGCLLFMGGTMVAGPALLIGLSGKYQSWVTWTGAYIPATAESFGVALLVLTVLCALFQLARRGPRWLMLSLAAAVLVGLTACGAYQRACTRERCDNGARDTYELLCGSVEAGLAADIPEQAPLVCEFNVWGGDKSAQEMFFLRYGNVQRNAYHVDSWEQSPQSNGEDVYFLCYITGYEGYDVVWLARTTDETTLYADSVRVYIQGSRVPADAVLSYLTVGADGNEVWHEVRIADLPRTEPNDNGDYFVTLEGENIVSRRISLWPADCE